jgi:glycerol-3-phosphate dehydrogenase
MPLEHRVEWAVRDAFARRLEDVLRRRSHLWLEGDRGRGAASEVAQIMARLLGWDEAQERREVAEWDIAVHAEEQLLDRAGWPPA